MTTIEYLITMLSVVYSGILLRILTLNIDLKKENKLNSYSNSFIREMEDLIL